ncbi:hypothetical protein P3S68_001901 [Capsicum galapagoense]
MLPYSFIMVAIGLSIQEPVDEAFGEGVDLVRWVHGASARGETPEQILDAKFSTISFAWRKEVVATLKVALICTDAIPVKRPRMKKVVECFKRLHKVESSKSLFNTKLYEVQCS